MRISDWSSDVCSSDLNFQDGKFAGWFLGNEPGADAYSTMSGIAVGTARAKAAESVTIVDIEDSTLGEEFSIGTGDKVIGGMFAAPRSEEHTSELQSLMRISYAVFCLQKQNKINNKPRTP